MATAINATTTYITSPHLDILHLTTSSPTTPQPRDPTVLLYHTGVTQSAYIHTPTIHTSPFWFPASTVAYIGLPQKPGGSFAFVNQFRFPVFLALFYHRPVFGFGARYHLVSPDRYTYIRDWTEIWTDLDERLIALFWIDRFGHHLELPILNCVCW